MLSLYLTKEGEHCPLNGVCGFGAPFDLRENVQFFKTNAFHFYDTLLGFNYYQKALKPHLPSLK